MDQDGIESEIAAANGTAAASMCLTMALAMTLRDKGLIAREECLFVASLAKAQLPAMPSLAPESRAMAETALAAAARILSVTVPRQ